MSTRQTGALSPTIGSREDLVGWIAAGSKPKSRWLIGTEHEKFVFRVGSHTPVPYEGPAGIRALMEEMIRRFGWEAIAEGDNIIALKQPDGPSDNRAAATISLEPGGQFELSGATLATVHETREELAEHLRQIREAGDALGLGFLGIGFSPAWTLDQTPRMPKQRYGIMARHMPRVGSRGLDMMYRTCTIQTNLDFGDESDMVMKLRVGLALQPVVTAMFASSSLCEGKPSGFRSLRSEVWRDTDKSRTGMLPFAFEPGMGFERYVDYALDVPMYFVYREGQYIDAAGASFRDFMAGRLPQLPGEMPTLDDWSDHLTTLFPEVRLKRFLEMRGADGGGPRQILALSAFWAGILYDGEALEAAWDLVKTWTADERQSLRDEVPRGGLAVRLRRRSLQEIAGQTLDIARRGLANRGCIDAAGRDEQQYLEPLDEIVESGRTAADDILERFEGRWWHQADPVFESYAFV
ncbi:MAG: glutamate--cysteine ligase [Hyphomicrobiaceae bacterium]